MAVVTYQPNASNQDTSDTRDGSGGHTLTTNHLRIVSATSGAANALWGALVLFLTDASAPTQGATINSAHLAVLCQNTTNTNLRATIHYLTNPPAALAGTDLPWDTYTLSATNLTRTASNISTTVRTNIDLTTLIQNLVNQSTWAPGQRIGLALLGNTGGNESFYTPSYDGSATNVMQLVIDWTAALPGPDLSGLKTRTKASGVVRPVTKTRYLRTTPAAAPTAPVVSAHPANTSVASGSTASFTATASDWTSVEWQYLDDTSVWQVASGSGVVNDGATSTYTTNATNSWHNGRQYRAVFTNAVGVTATNTATITVTGGGGGTGTFSDSVMWLPESITTPEAWNKHVQSGHENTDAIQVSTGTPVYPYLTTEVRHHPNDKFPAGSSARAEFRVRPSFGLTEGVGFWIGWMFYLPAGYPNPVNWGRIMGQFHGGAAGTNPTFAYLHKPDGSLVLELRGGATNANSRALQLMSPIPRGQTHRLKAYILPYPDNRGRTRVWVNGVQKVDNVGPNKYTDSNGYFKIGFYGSDNGTETWGRFGGFIRSGLEADVDLMFSLYTGT